jgi:hypothetical protein
MLDISLGYAAGHSQASEPFLDQIGALSTHACLSTGAVRSCL